MMKLGADNHIALLLFKIISNNVMFLLERQIY